MSMHQSDYLTLVEQMLGWFTQAKAAGASSNQALTGVVVAALGAAAQNITPPAPTEPPKA